MTQINMQYKKKCILTMLQPHVNEFFEANVLYLNLFLCRHLPMWLMYSLNLVYPPKNHSHTKEIFTKVHTHIVNEAIHPKFTTRLFFFLLFSYTYYLYIYTAYIECLHPHFKHTRTIQHKESTYTYTHTHSNVKAL